MHLMQLTQELFPNALVPPEPILVLVDEMVKHEAYPFLRDVSEESDFHSQLGGVVVGSVVMDRMEELVRETVLGV